MHSCCQTIVLNASPLANLSSAAVATLASEIADLRKALEGTLIDGADIGKCYDAATNGLLTPNATPATTGAIPCHIGTCGVEAESSNSGCGGTRHREECCSDTGGHRLANRQQDWLWSCDGTFEWHAKATVNF